MASEDLAQEVTRRADGVLNTHWPLPDTVGISAGSHRLATALAAQLFAENHGLQVGAAPLLQCPPPPGSAYMQRLVATSIDGWVLVAVHVLSGHRHRK